MSTVPQIGDTVRVGKGKSLWRIYAFGQYANGQRYAALEVVDGYSNTSATLDRLTIVSQETYAERLARQGDA